VACATAGIPGTRATHRGAAGRQRITHMLKAKVRITKVSFTKCQIPMRGPDGRFIPEQKLVPMTQIEAQPVFHENPEHENAKFWLKCPAGSLMLGCTTGEFDILKPDDELYLDITLATAMPEPKVEKVISAAKTPKLRMQ
jgi:hypothetical protein